MVRRVVAVLGAGGHVARHGEPGIDASAYAVAADVDLALLLRGDGVELALGAEADAGTLAGQPLPPLAAAHDLRGLLESGVDVLVAADDLGARGLGPADLLEGVRVVDAALAADVLREADAVLTF